MPEKTLAETIEDITKYHINQQPVIEQCTVIRNYPDDPYHIDIETPNGILTYVPCLLDNTIGHQGIVFYLNNNINQPIAIIEPRGD
jgi:hypothetical protein